MEIQSEREKLAKQLRGKIQRNNWKNAQNVFGWRAKFEAVHGEFWGRLLMCEIVNANFPGELEKTARLSQLAQTWEQKTGQQAQFKIMGGAILGWTAPKAGFGFGVLGHPIDFRAEILKERSAKAAR